jgi:hypothetical protein
MSVEDFTDLLKDRPVLERTAAAIARYIASTGSADVFDKLEELAEMLLYPKELSLVLRKRILTNWFAHRKVPVPQELVTRVGLSREDREKLKEKEEVLVLVNLRSRDSSFGFMEVHLLPLQEIMLGGGPPNFN